MMTFDRVLGELLRVCLDHDVEQFERVCVVRDLVGRVRVAVKGAAQVDLVALANALQVALNGYFLPPVLHTGDPNPERMRLAKTLLDPANAKAWPEQWPRECAADILGKKKRIQLDRWLAYQRVLSKESWLTDEKAQAPWPLTPHTPPILSFYSFKGGVGRTTICALVAAALARDGKRVLVIDLDLEAPGLNAVFGASARRGTLDCLVDFTATGEIFADDCYASATTLPAEWNERVQVVGCGQPEWSYLEKLARLDYSASHHGADNGISPVGNALGELLKLLRRSLSPDWILIDSRAGLHDLGGLSLHGAGHVDVLVARASQQNYEGLDLALQSLCRRKKDERFRPLVIHNGAPSILLAEGERIREEFRGRVYRSFETYRYSQGSDDAPSEDDRDAEHYPVVFSSRDELIHLQSLADLDLQPILDSAEFKEFMARLLQVTLRVGDDEEAEGETSEEVGDGDG